MKYLSKLQAIAKKQDLTINDINHVLLYEFTDEEIKNLNYEEKVKFARDILSEVEPAKLR